MVVGEPKVTRLRHSQLPLATGSALRSAEDARSHGAGRGCRRRQYHSWTFHIAASWMFVLLVTAPNLQTMAVIVALFTVSACCLASHTDSAGCRFPTHACGHP